MSQVTSQYGDTLINGLLAGMKFKAQNEELQLARLQRAEWEASAGHRQLLEQLQGETAQVGLSRAQTENQLALLQKKLTEQGFEDSLGAIKANRRTADANASRAEFENSVAPIEFGLRRDQTVAATESSRTQTKYTEGQIKRSEKLLPYEEQEAKSKASRAKIDAFAGGLNLAQGIGSMMPSGMDADILVESVLSEELGLSTPMQKQFVAGMIKERSSQAQMEIDQVKAARRQQIISEAEKLLSGGPQAIDTYRKAFPNDPVVQQVTDLADSMWPQYRQRQEETLRTSEGSFDRELNKQLAQSLGELQTKVAENKATIERLRKTGTPDNPTWSLDSTDVKREIEGLEAENATLQTQMDEARSQATRPERGSRQGIVNNNAGKKKVTAQEIKQLYASKGIPFDDKLDPQVVIDYFARNGYIVDRATVLEAQGKKGK